ncbi:MAG TPA: 2'-deoxycytidine 5'-triphosphate deaminase [Candidatus Udaeobacter sp.]|nr:2'-deoxycytidine 5'-triphosphate deaminase [Candidatus Udaeobacter sp.]
MAESNELFARSAGEANAGAASALQGTGILPYQQIKALIRDHEIWGEQDLLPDQVQPASLDLRLGRVAYRVRASFLPGESATVAEKIQQFALHEIDLTRGACLERDCVYVVPLLEHLQLSSRISAAANPKSSTGRLDIFTRIITDNGRSFDEMPASYQGMLYAEIVPRTFSIIVRQGSRLSQIRFRRGTPGTSASQLRRLHEQFRLVDSENPNLRGDAIAVTLDLTGEERGGLVGWRAKKHAELVDVDARSVYDPLDFWDAIALRPGRGLVLDPADFYVLATREAVVVPPDHAAEMLPNDTQVGEFRVHYAGFFDPGFGYDPAGGRGSRAVLEVRSRDVPFVLEHGQTVGWLRYEKLAATPDRLYGGMLGSHYQGQGLQLGRQFKPVVG